MIQKDLAGDNVEEYIVYSYIDIDIRVVRYGVFYSHRR